MTATIIIPARYGSERLRGKPLLHLAGKPLIHHVIHAADKTGLPVYVATDDDRIRDIVGAEACVIMTGECANGTERCAEAATLLGITGPVVNWQGDSPLIPADWIPPLLAALDEDGIGVATPVQRCNGRQARELQMEHAAGMPGGTCAVFDRKGRAIYFSKAPIPSRGPFWLHIGLYAYTGAALASYGRQADAGGPLEQSERLEQLRFLERGIGIQCVPVGGEPVWEVNNPSDLAIVERMLTGDDAAMR